jgi:hypothetical protein
MTRKEIEQKIRDFLDYHRDIDQDPRLEPVWVEFQPLLQAVRDEWGSFLAKNNSDLIRELEAENKRLRQAIGEVASMNCEDLERFGQERLRKEKA